MIKSKTVTVLGVVLFINAFINLAVYILMTGTKLEKFKREMLREIFMR